MKSLLSVVMLAATVGAWAQGQPPSQQASGEGPHGPPPEAVQACQGKAPGMPCRFASPRGEVAGTCEAPPPRRGPDGRPEVPGKAGGQTPPPPPLSCRGGDRPPPPRGNGGPGAQ